MEMKYLYDGARWMKDALTLNAMRLSNRVPEAIATLCFLAGFVVCAMILKAK